jgi:WD40 repeat protein
LYLYDQSIQQVGFIPIITGGGIGEIEWNPVDPQLIAIIAESLPNSRVEVWNVQSATLVFSTALFLSDNPHISWNSGGSQLAIVGGSIGEVWDITTGNRVFELNRTGDLATDRLFDVKWNPVQNLIATDGIGEEIILWDGSNGLQVAAIPQVGFMAWSPDGSQLALLNETLDIYDLNLEQVIHTFHVTGSPLSTLWQGNILVATSIVVNGNSFVQLVDTTTFQVIETIELGDTPIVALTSDGALLTLVDNAGNIDLRPIQPNGD